jgi:lipopolysaccharide biosynthesis regulator YciM
MNAIAGLEGALGVKNGKWTTEAEEKFASGFESYLSEGKAPAKGLVGLFEEFKSWLTDIYVNLTQSPASQELSPELRKVFDELFAEHRVKQAEEAGFKNEDISKEAQIRALSAHKDMLGHVNDSIKSLKQVVKEGVNPDGNTFERLKQQKLERIQSKKSMLEVPTEMTQDEIKSRAMEEKVIKDKEYAEAVQLVERQIQRSESINAEQLEFFENDLLLEEASYNRYIEASQLSNEKLEQMQQSLAADYPELSPEQLADETEAISLIEKALKEFSECARGEIDG